MNGKDVPSAKEVVAASRAMSGPRVDSGDDAVTDACERLHRVMASIDRNLTLSPSMATTLDVRAPVVAATATPASSSLTPPSALASRSSSTASLNKNPNLESSRSSSSSAPLTAAPPSEVHRRAPGRVTPSGAHSVAPPPLPAMPSRASAQLPDTSALLERWLRQDSQLGHSPLAQAPRPALAQTSTAAHAETATHAREVGDSTVEDSLLLEKVVDRTTYTQHGDVAHLPLSTSPTAKAATAATTGLFSPSAEALWSSALSSVQPARQAPSVPGNQAVRYAPVPVQSIDNGADGVTRTHGTSERPHSRPTTSWMPTTGVDRPSALNAAQPLSGPFHEHTNMSTTDTPASRSTWLPSSLLTYLGDESELRDRPSRVAPPPLVTRWTAGPMTAHNDVRADVMHTSEVGLPSAAALHAVNDTGMEAESDRLFSVLSARYAPEGNRTSASDGTSAAQPPSRDVPHASHDNAPSAAKKTAPLMSTAAGDAHVAGDGVVRSPPRPPMPCNSQTQTDSESTVVSSCAEDEMNQGRAPNSLLDVLHSRFHAQASSLLGDGSTSRSAPWTRSPRRTTSSYARDLSGMHSTLLVQQTRAATGGEDAEESPNETAMRQTLMEERIRRTRRNGSGDGGAAGRGVRDCGLSGTGGVPGRVVRSPRSATPRRLSDADDAVALYRAQCEAVAAEENSYLSALLARYEDALRASSQASRKAEDRTADGGDHGDAAVMSGRVCLPSPLPYEAADVQRRVAHLRRLTQMSAESPRGSGTHLTDPKALPNRACATGTADASLADAVGARTGKQCDTPRRDSVPPLPPPRSQSAGSVPRSGTADDGAVLEIPTPTREQLASTSPDKRGWTTGTDDGDNPLSIERERTPERMATSPRASVGTGCQSEQRPHSPTMSDVDEHTQCPPPPRPARRAPREPPGSLASQGEATSAAVYTPAQTPVSVAGERLHVSPERRRTRRHHQSHRRRHHRHGGVGSRDHVRTSSSSWSSSLSSFADSSSPVSSLSPLSPYESLAAAQEEAARVVRRRVGQLVSGGHGPLATASPGQPSGEPNHEAVSDLSRVPSASTARRTPRVSTAAASSLGSSVRRRAPDRDGARTVDRDRRARSAFERSVHVLQSRGVQVTVQLAESRVPALAQLSQDRTELLFVLHKHTAKVTRSPSRQASLSHNATSVRPAPRHPERDDGRVAPQPRPRPQTVSPAGARQASSKPLDIDGAHVRRGGLMLNTAAASQRFTTPLKGAPASPQRVPVPSAPQPPLAPGVKKKILMRVVRADDGTAQLIPALGPSPPAVVSASSTTAPSAVHSPSVMSQRTAAYHVDPSTTASHSGMSVRSAVEGSEGRDESEQTTVRVRERHHLPLRHARLLLPGHVLGSETDLRRAGPGGFEDVHGLLCGPAACEVLRRYRCTLFADLAHTGLASYRLFLVIPEFRRIDVPENAVLLVIDCRTRIDWIRLVLTLQGIVCGAPYLSYGRALWLLAARRCQYAHALKGLNPFDMHARFTITARHGQTPTRTSSAGARGRTSQVGAGEKRRPRGGTGAHAAGNSPVASRPLRTLTPRPVATAANASLPQRPAQAAVPPPTSLLYRTTLAPQTPSSQPSPSVTPAVGSEEHPGRTAPTGVVSLGRSQRALSLHSLRRFFARSFQRHHAATPEPSEKARGPDTSSHTR